MISLMIVKNTLEESITSLRPVITGNVGSFLHLEKIGFHTLPKSNLICDATINPPHPLLFTTSYYYSDPHMTWVFTKFVD